MTSIALLFSMLALTPEEQAQLSRTVAVESANLQQSPDNTEALYRLGLAYLALGDAKKAVKPLQTLVAKDAESLDGKLMLARAYRLSGEPQKAKELLDKAIISLPDEPALKAERGLLARSMGETDAAIEYYGKAVELSPKDAELHFNYGEALQAKPSRRDEAIAQYKLALDLKPTLTSATVNLAKAYAEKGRYNEAKELLTQVTKGALADAEAHYNLAVLLMRENNVTAAVAEYERALAINPQHAHALNNLGVAYDSQANHKKAVEYFTKATQADPLFAEAFFNLGLAYFRLNDGPKATKAFEQALKLDQSNDEPYIQLGMLYLQQGKRDRAAIAFKKSIEIADEAQKEGGKYKIARKYVNKKRSADAYRGLALAYLGLGKRDDAVATLKAAVNTLPDDPSAHEALGEAYMALGRADDAVKELQRRLELEPSTEARLDLARAYTKARKAKEAEPIFQSVVKAEPDNVEARLGLVDLLLAMGSYAQAEKLLTEMLQKDPHQPQALSRAGILHSRMGRPDKALPELQEAANRDPTLFEARAELGYVLHRNSETDEGLKVLSDVLQDEPRLPIGLYYFGVLIYAKGQTRQAEESFKAAVTVDPTLAQAHFSLGELYEQNARLDDARKAYDVAAKLGFDEAKQALKKLGGAK